MSAQKPVIGILALQGAVQPHKAHIEAAGAEFRAVKTPAQFDAVDGFILPGGESTTMLKLIDAFNLWEPLERNFKTKPVWGICAGSILMARKVTVPLGPSSRRKPGSGQSQQDPVLQRDDERTQKSFGLLPVSVERNAYGRQLESHHADIEDYKVSFIRAPVFKDVGADVEILAEDHGTPVWVRQGPYMATAFHPELTLSFPSPMHRMFMDMVRDSGRKKAA